MSDRLNPYDLPGIRRAAAKLSGTVASNIVVQHEATIADLRRQLAAAQQAREQAEAELADRVGNEAAVCDAVNTLKRERDAANALLLRAASYLSWPVPPKDAVSRLLDEITDHLKPGKQEKGADGQ